jgi:AraC-like DNA-binding protein
LTTPERLLPTVQSATFVERAARADGLDTLGIVVGQQTQAWHLGEFGYLMSRSLTLYDLFTTLERTINLMHSGERFRMIEQADGVWLQSHLYALDRCESPHTQYFSLMVYLNLVRLALGPEWQPAELHVAAKPDPALLATGIFEGIQVRWGTPHNAIKLPKSLLSLPLRPAPGPPGSCPQASYDDLYQSAPAEDFGLSLKQLIESFLPQGYPDIAKAAQALGLGVRSFQRRLTEADLSYSHLVEQVRFNLAISWLQDPSLKIADIAAELGYNDPANFTRAFKRWTGVSPLRFRQQQQEQAGGGER